LLNRFRLSVLCLLDSITRSYDLIGLRHAYTNGDPATYY